MEALHLCNTLSTLAAVTAFSFLLAPWQGGLRLGTCMAQGWGGHVENGAHDPRPLF